MVAKTKKNIEIHTIQYEKKWCRFVVNLLVVTRVIRPAGDQPWDESHHSSLVYPALPTC